jgi:hypothetical protein
MLSAAPTGLEDHPEEEDWFESDDTFELTDWVDFALPKSEVQSDPLV